MFILSYIYDVVTKNIYDVTLVVQCICELCGALALNKRQHTSVVHILGNSNDDRVSESLL